MPGSWTPVTSDVPQGSLLDQWYALVAKKTSVILVCFRRKSIASRAREVILPSYSALMRPRLDCCVRFWALQYMRDMELLEVQWRAM